MNVEIIFAEFGGRGAANQKWESDIGRLDPTYSSVKEMGGFEPREDAYDHPNKNEEGTYVYRGDKGMSSWGNEFPQLNNYKFNVVFGHEKMTYLSDGYLDSEYIYECARGNVVSDHPITNVSNILVKDVKTQTFYMKED